MKYIVNINEPTASADIASCSATLIIAQDSFDETVPDESLELFRFSLSARKNINFPGWYQEAIADMTADAQSHINSYLATMAKVVAGTGLQSIPEIMADMKTKIEGGLV